LSFPFSLLPSDTRCVPIALKCASAFAFACSVLGVVDSLTVIDAGCSEEAEYGTHLIACWFETLLSIRRLVDAFSYSVFATWLGVKVCRRSNAGHLIKIAYRLLSFGFGCNALGELALFGGAAFTNNAELAIGFAVQALVSIMLSVVALQMKFIRRWQSWLMSRGQEATAAASLSELLGGRDSELLLVAARTSFLCVSADKLRREDMAESKPNPALAVHAQHAELGLVDAFLSHSWHDDPDRKWEVLQEWRRGFKKRKNREPTLWIDKYCIDQRNIEDSLACLPVYLAGCKNLLILCGKSYLHRLWCLIEIFVFLEMGGKHSNLEVILLDNRRSVRDRAQGFDARDAQCFVVEDTIRLQKVIEATGYDKINALVINAVAPKVYGRLGSMP